MLKISFFAQNLVKNFLFFYAFFMKNYPFLVIYTGYEHSIFHKLGVGTARTTVERFDKGKDFILKDIEFTLWLKILEARPAQLILIFFEDRIFNGFA